MRAGGFETVANLPEIAGGHEIFDAIGQTRHVRGTWRAA